MTLESDLEAAQECARMNVEKSLALESALFVLESELAEFQAGKLKALPQKKGVAEGIYQRLHELSREYRELEELREFLPLRCAPNEPARWLEYGKRLAHTGSPAHAQEFLWKSFYGTLPVSVSWWGSVLLHTHHSVFSVAGERSLRLEVASELVPVLYSLGQKDPADRLCAHMMHLIADGNDKPLIKEAHIALGNTYARLRNEKFAQYHAGEAEKI